MHNRCKHPPDWGNKEFALWVGASGASLPKFVVLVPKRIVKLAVKRNRIKRIARALFWQGGCKRNSGVVLLVKNFADHNWENLTQWRKRLSAVLSAALKK